MGPQHLLAGLARQLSVYSDPSADDGVGDVEQLERGAEIVRLKHQPSPIARLAEAQP